MLWMVSEQDTSDSWTLTAKKASQTENGWIVEKMTVEFLARQ